MEIPPAPDPLPWGVPGRRPRRVRAEEPRGVASWGVAASAGVFSYLSYLEIPPGILIAAVLCGVAIFLALRRTRRHLTVGVTVRPMRSDLSHPGASGATPAPGKGPSTPRLLPGGPRPEPPDLGEEAIAPGPGEMPSLAPEDRIPAAPTSSRRLQRLPVLEAAGGRRIPMRRGYSAYAVPTDAKGGPQGAAQVQQPAPGLVGFGWKVAIAYAAIAVPLLGFSPYFLARAATWLSGTPFPAVAPKAIPYFFVLYDTLVQGLGSLLFWPQPWPGPAHLLQGPNPVVHTAADFIFVMYLIMMIAFLLACGLIGRGKYTGAQRATAGGTVLAYVVTSLLADVFFYSIRPGLFYSSATLLGRAFLGGLFFSFLLFQTLVAPPVVMVERRFPRRRGDLATFWGSALLSIAIGFAVLFGAYEFLGVGARTTVLGSTSTFQVALEPFGLLLLLPLISLTIWALIGRALYTRDLRHHPPLPLLHYHPPVSVLIPAYNEEGSIANTLRAADEAARLYPGQVEILVGNDGSSDRTSAVAAETFRHLKHAVGRVIDLPHGGKSSALNGALRAARGEVVIRVDADTRISPVYGFGAAVPHFSDPEVGGVQGLILPLQREGWTRKLRMLEIVWNHVFLRRATYGTGTAQVVDGAFCAFRRTDLLSLGGWVPWNGEDTEITYRLMRAGYRFRYETRAVAYEDVPPNYRQLKKQRIRWTRGGYFAHHRHAASLFSNAPEFGGLAMLFWLALFIRGSMRQMVYVYAGLMTLLLGLQTFYHLAIIIALLLVPRGLIMAYYLVRLRASSFLPWILAWPFTSALKQFIAVEGYGTILPGAIPEFSE